MSPQSITPLAEPPLVSVIMPTHNAGRYIGAAIESVLAQSYAHWELIIVDDASTDDTAQVVSGFLGDARIRYHRSARIGHPAGVRNQGFRLAQGELIAFLDSDDVYYPDTLAKLSAPLLANPSINAVYGFAFAMDEHERSLPNPVELLPLPATRANQPCRYQLPPDYSHSWAHIVTSQISCLLAGLMLRRSLREQIGFFNETLCGPEDYEYYVRMFLSDYDGVFCLSDYVYRYRIHSASLTKTPEHADRLLSSCMRIMDWLFEEAPIPDSVRSLRSRAYMECYRYLARERLLHRQPKLGRQLIQRALENPHVAMRDWMRLGMPLWLRSFLPSSVDQALVELRRTLRHIERLTAGNPRIRPAHGV